MSPKPRNTSQVEFCYLASDLFPFEAIRKWLKPVLKDPNQLDVFVGALSNKLHFHELSLVPVFDVSNARHTTARKLIEREIKDSPDIYFADFCRDMKRWSSLRSSVRSAFRTDKGAVSSALRREYDFFSCGDLCPTATSGCLFCFGRDLVATKLVADGLDKEIRARIISCSISISSELGRRLSKSLNALCGGRTGPTGFRPKAGGFQHFQEEPECSVRATLGGHFESKRRRF
ncbi:MAG: hypothetical protein FD161_927 [Limisphaerales bacterium]|nr:MAG: hypothetical protein FD161_927 [Limisphaerales bacterium]KAG0509909.1 MAG: hypothetical protein E1N63_927 [Limisphaerales bacterium]TXT50620.1 MAG: hypothetical protein FD140_2252 [Limisphaerales bacterium]